MIDVAFSISSLLALVAWLVLIAFPSWRIVRQRVIGIYVPALFASAYSLLFPALYFQSPGGFSSVSDLTVLLTSHPAIVLAAWLHYLAFDLLIGKMIVDDAQDRQIPHYFIIIPLVCCFLFGPLGLLMFILLRQFAVRERPCA